MNPADDEGSSKHVNMGPCKPSILHAVVAFSLPSACPLMALAIRIWVQASISRPPVSSMGSPQRTDGTLGVNGAIMASRGGKDPLTANEVATVP